LRISKARSGPCLKHATLRGIAPLSVLTAGVLVGATIFVTGCDASAPADAGLAESGVSLDAAARSDSGPEHTQDAGPDERPDAGPPPEVDAGSDAGTDLGIDGGVERWADFCESRGIVAMEAEAFSDQFGYHEVRRDDASGGAAMQVGGSGVLSFHINIETAGTWYFWPRTLAPGSEDNGMRVEIDGVFMTAPRGNPYAGVDDIWVRKSSTEWFWEPMWQGSGSGQVAGPVTFELSAGPHTFSIHKRLIERPLIDRVVLTLGDTPPTGSGPGETPCR